MRGARAVPSPSLLQLMTERLDDLMHIGELLRVGQGEAQLAGATTPHQAQRAAAHEILFLDALQIRETNVPPFRNPVIRVDDDDALLGHHHPRLAVATIGGHIGGHYHFRRLAKIEVLRHQRPDSLGRVLHQRLMG